MVKRKCNLLIQSFTPTDETDCCFMLWMDDDDDLVSRVRSVVGVASLEPPSHGEMWWRLIIDPRYGVAEVKAEIKALADGKEPCKRDTLDSLEAEARDLGQRAAQKHAAWPTIMACVAGADEHYGPSASWLSKIRRDLEQIYKKRGLDPQPEPSLAEAARALGQKAGAAGIPFTVAKEFLEAAEKTYGKSYPEVLPGIIRIIAERIEFGHWQ